MENELTTESRALNTEKNLGDLWELLLQILSKAFLSYTFCHVVRDDGRREYLPGLFRLLRYSLKIKEYLFELLVEGRKE